MTNPGYLLGRAVGHVACLLVRPVAPFAESALAGVLDGLFGEPDELDVSYTPTPAPFPPPGYAPIEPAHFDEVVLDGQNATYDSLVASGHLAPTSVAYEEARAEWLESLRVRPGFGDPTWTLDRDRIDEIRGDAA